MSRVDSDIEKILIIRSTCSAMDVVGCCWALDATAPPPHSPHRLPTPRLRSSIELTRSRKESCSSPHHVAGAPCSTRPRAWLAGWRATTGVTPIPIATSAPATTPFARGGALILREAALRHAVSQGSRTAVYRHKMGNNQDPDMMFSSSAR
jgi:hypothetical protein